MTEAGRAQTAKKKKGSSYLKQFKKAKQMFMEATKTLQEMGPMLAMFGGADGGMGLGRGAGSREYSE